MGCGFEKENIRRLIISLIVLISIIFFFYFQNNSIVTTEMTISSAKIPSGFDEYKIVQLSDLHSKSFWKNQSVLVKKVKRINPDLIVFTGDLVDAKRYDEEPSLILMKEMVQIAPVYYTTGNHEWWSGRFNSLESKLSDLDVRVMRNKGDVITNGTDKIRIIGIDDPALDSGGYSEQAVVEDAIVNSIKDLPEDSSFKILLSHRPEMISLYSHYKFDLVFSGHAHGGQLRIPFVGGLVAPNQGFFPKYTAGTYRLDDTTMVVNRGLGNSIIPLRIFNRPEIVVVTIKSK